MTATNNPESPMAALVDANRRAGRFDLGAEPKPKRKPPEGKLVALRFSAAEWAEVQAMARQEERSINATAKRVYLHGVAGYKVRMERLQELLQQADQTAQPH